MFDKLQQIGIEIYNKGLTEGKKGAYSLENMKQQSELSYQCGLNDAWRAARWIMDLTSDDVKRHDVIGDCAPKYALTKYSASQAIELIRKYEEKQNRNEIAVGDEVYCLDPHYLSVVTAIVNEGKNKIAVQITQSGKWSTDNVSNLHRTGKYYPQIRAVIAELRDDANGNDIQQNI